MFLLTFRLCEHRYALHIEGVERVLRAMEITPIPEGPPNVLGLINVHGHVIPVFGLRRHFGLPEKEIDLGDQLIIARAGGQPVALLVDAVSGVEDCPPEQETEATSILPGFGGMEGVARLPKGMVVIEDLDRLFAPRAEELADATGG